MNVKALLKLVLILTLFLGTLIIGYAPTITNISGDSYEYYGLIHDMYKNHYSFFDWSAAGGYNLFATIYLYSYLIGSFTYNSPIAFFLIVNISELILLLASFYLFLFAIGLHKNEDIKPYLYLIPTWLSFWNIACCLAKGSFSMYFSFSSLFMIFNDAVIIMLMGWFLNILAHIHRQNKVPKLSVSLFVLISYYMGATTLRYLSNAVALQLAILVLILFFIQSKPTKLKLNENTKENKSLNKVPTLKLHLLPSIKKQYIVILFTLLGLVFILSYISFFALESYDISSFHIYRNLSFSQALNGALISFISFLNDFSNPENNLITLFMRLVCLIGIFLGAISTLGMINVKLNKFNLARNNQVANLFLMLGFLTWALILISGIVSHGTTFWHAGLDAWHYFDLAAIFAVAGLSSLIVGFSKVKQHSFLLSVSSLIIMLIIAGVSFINSFKLNPVLVETNLLQCINANKKQYALIDGLGDYWVARPIRFNPNNSANMLTFLNQEPGANFYWLNNVFQPVNKVNFLVYSNDRYKFQAIDFLASKIPNFSYQEINCGNNDGIIVFDSNSANLLSKIMQQRAKNAKAFFATTDYSFGQEIWQAMPWNAQFIKNYHTYTYYGSVLAKLNPSFNYTNNNDLSVSASNYNGNNLNTPGFGTDPFKAAMGNYQLILKYKSNQDLNAVLFNLTTSSVMNSWTIDATQTTSKIDFTISRPTKVMMLIFAPLPATEVTLNSLSINKIESLAN